MAFRRRRRTGTWLPVYGAEVPGTSGPTGVPVDATGFHIDLSVPSSGAIRTIIGVLTNDSPIEGTVETALSSLSDVIGSEWFLQRIVGKISAVADGSEDTFRWTKVGVGFFVARAESGVTSVPVGATTADNVSDSNDYEAKTTNQYSPLAMQAGREPWIWRRTWLLNSGNSSIDGPTSNMGFGSVSDGPHIDAKTKRRITNDDRLFYAVAGVRWPYSTDPGPADNTHINIDMDVRLFGQLRRARNRGAF